MLNFVVVVFAVLLYCYTSPFFNLVDPINYSVSLPEKFDGALTPNDKLEKAEHFLENTLYWPESFDVYGGHIYTGLGDGRIVRILGDKMETVVRTGKECGGQHEESICGRPLGIEFSKSGLLYVVDAYYGLLTVDIKTGKRNRILPSDTIVDGKPLTFLNDLALDEKEGVVYLTQSSSKWNISYVIISILEHDTSGRLLKYNLKTKEVQVLLKDLSFPNGVILAHDRSALLVAEGNKHKIFKYYIDGPNADTMKELPMVLPGEPDNISRNKRGNYWVGISSARTKESPSLYDRVSEYKLLRAIFIHVHRLATSPICLLLDMAPYPWAKELAFELKTGRIAADLPLSYGIIVEFDGNGKIVQSLHSPSGNMAHISEVLEHNGYLYLGSWRNRFIGRLKL